MIGCLWRPCPPVLPRSSEFTCQKSTPQSVICDSVAFTTRTEAPAFARVVPVASLVAFLLDFSRLGFQPQLP